MTKYSFISEIEKFLEGEENYNDSVAGFEPDPSQVAKKRKREVITGVDEDDEELNNDVEPDLTGNLEDEDIIMPDALDPKNGNSIEEFMNRFNILRATKSLKSEDVFYVFKDYFKSLSYEERLAFYVFIVGMTQVTTLSLGEEEGKGSKPSDFGINISYESKSKKVSGSEEKEGEEESKDEVKPDVNREKDKEMEKQQNVFSKNKSFVSVINTESRQDKTKILDYLKLING